MRRASSLSTTALGLAGSGATGREGPAGGAVPAGAGLVAGAMARGESLMKSRSSALAFRSDWLKRERSARAALAAGDKVGRGARAAGSGLARGSTWGASVGNTVSGGVAGQGTAGLYQ